MASDVDARAAIGAILEGRRLAGGEAEIVMHGIMDGKATAAQIGALLVLLRQRGETVAEISGFARAMRERVLRVRSPGGVLFDTCGTGGDGAGTFNISTLASLVVAAAGVRVAKHGNRSVSSRVGSADLLEGLGIRIDLPAPASEDSLRHTGFAFLFAPLHHTAMQHAAGVRRELGVRTIFNLLGPLTNPAGATHQLLGVYAPELVPKLAEVLRELGAERALVVHGAGGLDEISPAGPTLVAELRHGKIDVQTWRPEDVGISPSPVESLRGGDVADNLALAKRVLQGERGPLQDAVTLNAGAALYVAGASGDWWKGVRDARLLLESGQVHAKAVEIAAFTQRVHGGGGGGDA